MTGMYTKQRAGNTPEDRGAPSPSVALAAMMSAVAMTFIDRTIVAIATPDIVDELGLSASGMQWVVNAYLLALAAFFALGGRLADLFGPRRIVVIGTLVFVISSILCGCVPRGDFALTWLVVFRSTQGLGAALLFPAALAVVVAVFPVERRGRALALFFGVTGALTALGPLLGGWLTDWTWRAIFWVNVPVAVVALILTALAHVSGRRRDERLDVPGAVLIALGMGASVLGFQQASAWGWDSALTWVCVAGGLAVLWLFCRYDRERRGPGGRGGGDRQRRQPAAERGRSGREHGAGVDVRDPHGLRPGQPVGLLRNGHRPGHRIPVRRPASRRRGAPRGGTAGAARTTLRAPQGGGTGWTRGGRARNGGR
ncbi:cyanate permease [Streptomyces sp. B4I13]|nr:cyanate permease [Streptomyces sp. B4I13]